jgi:hypothetical protein
MMNNLSVLGLTRMTTKGQVREPFNSMPMMR